MAFSQYDDDHKNTEYKQRGSKWLTNEKYGLIMPIIFDEV